MVARLAPDNDALSDLFQRLLKRTEDQIDTLARLDTTVEGLVKTVDKLSSIEIRVQLIEHDQQQSISRRDKFVALFSAGFASISATFTILGHFFWAR